MYQLLSTYVCILTTLTFLNFVKGHPNNLRNDNPSHLTCMIGKKYNHDSITCGNNIPGKWKYHCYTDSSGYARGCQTKNVPLFKQLPCCMDNGDYVCETNNCGFELPNNYCKTNSTAPASCTTN